ncbi:MAG TPA: SEC-C metal-binding domain-containing protein [Casimicrobiaceae bacterium]
MTAAVQRTVSRNDPCPCGSGRRYKECHGSLRAGVQSATPAAAPRRGQYRPSSGSDWAALAEEDRDRLGAVMERALAEQVAQRLREAERLYRAVLEEAPRTHDALHMLGVIRLGLGDFTDAERLIERAMALRPEYPAIASNWSLVQRSIAARDRRGIELVCEHALPLLFETLRMAGQGRVETARPGDRAAPLHVVGPALDVVGHATWLARRLRRLLGALDPQAWNAADDGAERGAWRSLASHRIDAPTGRHPRGGHVVLAGVECDTDAWLRDPIDRVLVFASPASPSTCLERLRRIAADGGRSLTLVFDSHARARRFGPQPHVLPPPIDIAEFAAVAGNGRARDARTLRVATLGQDRRRVVVADDHEHLRTVAEHAGRLAILDPGPLRYLLGPARPVVCVPRDGQSLAAFLGDNDLYLHRVQPWWSEEPRTLFGAMLLGVPVLCPRGSIYAEYIDDGVDGWLYEDEAAAAAVVDSLRDDRRGVAAAGAAARAKALRLFEPNALASAYAELVSRWASAR